MPHGSLAEYETKLRKLRVIERLVHRNRLRGVRLSEVNAALRAAKLPPCESPDEVRDWLYGRFGHRKLSVDALFWEALMAELAPGFASAGDGIEAACQRLGIDFEAARARAIARAGLVKADADGRPTNQGEKA